MAEAEQDPLVVLATRLTAFATLGVLGAKRVAVFWCLNVKVFWLISRKLKHDNT